MSNEPVPVQRDIRKVESWEDVDRAMGVLRGIEAELGGLGADFDAQIAAIQAAKQKQCKPLLAKRERVEELITTFAEANRESLPKGRKSMKLVHGQIGWKLGRKVLEFTRGEAATLTLAQQRGLDSLVRTTIALDKTALKKLTRPEQMALGVTIIRSEELYIKLSADPAIEYPSTGDDSGEGEAA